MNHGQRKPLYARFVQATSATVAMSLPLLEMRQDDVPVNGDGIAILALPRELVDQSRPLSGWECFPLPEPVMIAPPGGEPASRESVPDPGTLPEADRANCRIEVFGHVNQGSRRVYCFLDTGGGRWFRMVEGGIDVEARVALLKGKNGGRPLLLDIQTGQEYRIAPGSHHLLPLNEPSTIQE